MLFAVLLWAEGEQAPSNPLAGMMVPMLLMLVVGYFLLMRPMQKQEKQRQALVASLKKNDEVVTSGGIIGVVDSIKDKKDEVVLKGGLRITKSSIVRVVNPEEAARK